MEGRREREVGRDKKRTLAGWKDRDRRSSREERLKEAEQ